MTKSRSLYIVTAIIVSIVIPWLVVGPVLDNPSVVQDDFRQSMYWLWRFWDPALFPDDFLATIFETSFNKLPLLYLFYKIAPAFTSDLLYYAKFTSIILAFLTSIVGYFYMEKISGKSYLALAFAVMLSTILWCTDHISAMHSRSFIWIFILAYILLKEHGRDLWAVLTTFVALFISPLAFLISLVMEGFDFLFKFFNSKNKSEVFKSVSFIGSVINAIVVLVFYKLVNFSFVNYPYESIDLFSNDELRQLPELNPGGRHPIFGSSLFDGSWWKNEHWGLGIGFLEISQVLIVALILVVIYLFFKKFKIDKSIFQSRLAYLFYAAISLYLLAQIVFPLLYMPSRYLGIPFLIIAPILILLILDKFLIAFFTQKNKAKHSKKKEKKTYYSLVISFILIFSVFFWSHYHKHTFTRYEQMHPELMQVFKKLPRDSYVAAHPLLPEINLLPAISKRKIYMSYEHSIPSFDRQVLEEVRKRNINSLKITYSSSPEEIIDIMNSEGITHFIVSAGFYSEQYLNNPRYMNPYNGFLRDLIDTNRGNYYLWNFMQRKNLRYGIVTPESIKKDIQDSGL